MASDLLQLEPSHLPQPFRRKAGSVKDQRMRKDSLIRFSAVGLALATATLMVFAVINWQKESLYSTPWDGVWWREDSRGLIAQKLSPNGPGEKSGIKVGDRLLQINGQPKDRPIKSFMEFEKLLHRTGVYSKATYMLDRRGVNVEVQQVIPEPADNSMKLGERLIALIYLAIGFYVLFRRWTAPKSTHFYLFCLVSFVLYSFHYTGKLNTFDWIIYWSNVVATLLQPALFLHFAITFPRPRKLLARHPWAISLAYLPGIVLLALQIVMIELFESAEWLR